jgi:hypothetical protein
MTYLHVIRWYLSCTGGAATNSDLQLTTVAHKLASQVVLNDHKVAKDAEFMLRMAHLKI